MKTLILIGPSGVGKSTYAVSWSKGKNGPIKCSADDFPGLYEGGQFNFSLLGKAHQECFLKFLDVCQEGSIDVIVDNTNCSMDQLAPYIRVATAYETDLEIVALIPKLERFPNVDGASLNEALAKRNVHGTPAKAIGGMIRSMSNMLNHWPNYFPPIKKVEVLL